MQGNMEKSATAKLKLKNQAQDFMIKIAIILGSTRPNRNGEGIAKWVYELSKSRDDAEFELIDLKDFDLPLLDEPIPPTPSHQKNVHQILDQVIAWANVLKLLRTEEGY